MQRRTLLAAFAAAAGAPRGSRAAAPSASGSDRPDLGAALPAAGPAAPRPDASPPTLRWPDDFGAHPRLSTEWWYLTGAISPVGDERRYGFQITFFRAATGIATDPPGAFDPAQLVFAHAALSDVGARRLHHDQRIARSGFGIADAAQGDTAVVLRDWTLVRGPQPDAPRLGRYRANAASESAGFAFELTCDATQPLLLQGDAGVSRKGPEPAATSFYYSEPQLAVRGTLTRDAATFEVRGRAWLDHEWSDAYVPAGAVGWDWIGMNLDDGSALMAFRMRRADASTLYAGGSFRRRGEAARDFGAGEVHFTPLRIWESAASKARYPVRWSVETPAGRMIVAALFDDQELDSRRSTGAIYWEGLSDLLDDAGRPIGRGYLEMTGYASALRL